MRRLLILLPLGLALLGLLGTEQANSQQPGSAQPVSPQPVAPKRGVLDTGLPPETPAPGTPGLPPGVVPAQDPSPAQPPATGAAPAEPEASSVQAPSSNNPYPVTPEAGPWMICAASYIGPDAPELARQVCEELRNRHKLAAYIFNYADQERVKQRQDLERLKKLYPGVPWRKRTVRVQESCAVLVGGFKSIEEASEALKQVKNLPLPKLQLPEGKSPYDLVNIYEPDPEKKKTVVKRAPVNPFSNAMAVRNPTVPAPPQERPKFDPFWKELNADEEYSLLRCSRPWTLVVKEYHGAAIVTPRSASSNFLKMLGMGNQKPGEGLSAAALQAHELAKLLRHPSLGFESYVLHTRDRSIVTVGGFNELNGADMQRVQRQLAALKFSTGKGAHDPVGLMAVPIPMEVPRP